MLPPSLIKYDHELLLKYMTSVFLEKYDVGCCAALHHNKSKTNLHIHLIFLRGRSGRRWNGRLQAEICFIMNPANMCGQKGDP